MTGSTSVQKLSDVFQSIFWNMIQCSIDNMSFLEENDKKLLGLLLPLSHKKAIGTLGYADKVTHTG